MKVLVVEDEERVSDFVSRSLTEAGYETEVAATGDEAIRAFRKGVPDLVLLDLMLPDCSGIDVLGKIRSGGSRAPVLVLSARSALGDRVSALDAGADDYLGKPFPLEELLARVRALLRRSRSGETVRRFGDVTLDLNTRKVTRGGRVVFLSTTEFSLLELLSRPPAGVVSKAEILREVWDDEARDPNVVEVYVNYLRNKLERGGAPRVIYTVRGHGYALHAAPQGG